MVAGHFHDDPAELARAGDFYRRFDALVDARADDRRDVELARDVAAYVPTELSSQAEPVDLDAHPLGAAFLRDLSPAQAEVVRAVHRIWIAR